MGIFASTRTEKTIPVATPSLLGMLANVIERLIYVYDCMIASGEDLRTISLFANMVCSNQ